MESLHFDRKLVFVKFDALGLGFPTLSFAFCRMIVSPSVDLIDGYRGALASKSFFLSFFFFWLDPMVETKKEYT
jgi:hypothetical protein